MQIDVSDIQKIDVKPGQVLVVTVDPAPNGTLLPIATFRNIMANTASVFKQALPGITVIIAPANTHTLTVISQSAANSLTNGSSAPVTSGDAFDRAMKGLA